MPATHAASKLRHVPEVNEAQMRSPELPSKREIELDFLRGIAILMVLDFHAPVHWMFYPFHLLRFPNFGWAGVDIFFVLSGFLVGGLLIKEWKLQGTIDHKRFLIRRGLKIWPQYYVFLGLMLVTGHRALHELWGNIFNVQNYVGGIPHTWSLAVEEHAYLLLAILLAFSSRRSIRMRIVASLVGVSALAIVIARYVLVWTGRSVVTQTHTRLEGILYGVLLAMLYHGCPELFWRLQRWTWLWLCTFTGSLVFFRYQGTSPWATSMGWDVADLLGISLLMLVYRPTQVKRSPPYKVVAAIGFYSYGIYLWHVSVIAPTVLLTSRLPHWLSPIGLALVPIIGGICLGALFTRVVELPVLKLRDRLYPKRVSSPLYEGVGHIERRRIHEGEITGHTVRA